MPRTLRPDISEALQAVMIKGTAKLPTERYATVVELRAALERALDDTASNTSPARSTLVRSGAGTRELHEEPMATRRLSFAWVAGAFVVLAAGAGGYVWIARDSTATPSVSPQASLVVPLTVTETAVAQPAPDISAAQSAATDLASSASGAGGVTEPTDDATRPQAPVGSNPLREAPRLATKPVETTSREVDRGAAKIAVTPPNGKSTVAVQPALNIQAPVSVVPPLSAPVSEVSDVSIAAAPSPAPSPNSEPSSDASAPGGLSRVIKGVTRQSDLLKLFGGPNLTTLDAQGRDVWVYERTVTQTDTRSAANIASGNADFGVFWGTGEAGASASTDQSATMLSSGSSIRTVTAIVTFDGDRTVLDYTVKANYF